MLPIDRIIPLSNFEIFVLCWMGLGALGISGGFALALYSGFSRPLLALAKRRRHRLVWSGGPNSPQTFDRKTRNRWETTWSDWLVVVGMAVAFVLLVLAVIIYFHLVAGENTASL